VLSYANRRRLEMARALATEPTLLLLDEPTAGMNPRETLELRDHIVRMRDERGVTIVVIEHDMRVVKGVSDRVIACDYGQKIAEGTYDEVAHDPHVIEAYLGTKAVG
jgi:branched-chain amino acid transport system ATP-binding protein